MFRFSYFVSKYLWKSGICEVFWKYAEKIKISSNIQISNVLQMIRLRGVYLELRI
jgi:hypothetical protein